MIHMSVYVHTHTFFKIQINMYVYKVYSLCIWGKGGEMHKKCFTVARCEVALQGSACPVHCSA